MASRSTKESEPRPSDRRPFPGIGDISADRTYRSIGEALTYWEFFEIHLARLFSVLVGTRQHPIVAMRAYGSVLSFEARATMVEQAARSYFYIRGELTSQLDDDVVKLMRHASTARGAMKLLTA
jgi:hypothetical protein